MIRVNERADGVRYPTEPPDGFTFLGDAFGFFGHEIVNGGLGWNRTSLQWAEIDLGDAFPTTDEAFDGEAPKASVHEEWREAVEARLPSNLRGRPISRSAWATAWTLRAEAEKRRLHALTNAVDIARAFNRAAAAGEIITAYRRIEGGRAHVIDRSTAEDWWQPNDALLRFRTFSIDPEQPFLTDVSLPCWLYVETGSLNAMCKRIHRDQRGWPDENWAEAYVERLTDAFTASTTLPPTKTELRKWLGQRVRAGATQTEVVKEYPSVFKGNKWSRAFVRDEYEAKFMQVYNETLKSGPRRRNWLGNQLKRNG